MSDERIQYEPWQVVRKLGQGAFGSVYEIQRDEFGETYRAALKVVSIPNSDDDLNRKRASGMTDQSMTTYYDSVVEEMTHEIALLSKLKGKTNIVGYEDHRLIRQPNGIGWDILIRMELLTSLTDVSVDYRLSRDVVAKLGIDICNALIICHERSIIHRDIKPDNIFVSDDGDFELGDFGIARIVSNTISDELSRKGTPNYMAPEIYLGKKYSEIVDLYSLGIVLYQLMNNGRLPFMPIQPTASSSSLALQRRMSGESLPIPEMADREFAEVILKACAYSPADRYASAEEMRNALQKVVNGRNVKFDFEPAVVWNRKRQAYDTKTQKLNTSHTTGTSYNASVNNQHGGMNSQNSGYNPNGSMNNQSSAYVDDATRAMNPPNNTQAGSSSRGVSINLNSKQIMAIGGGVIALLLVIILAMSLGGGKKQTTEASAQPTTTQTTTADEAQEQQAQPEQEQPEQEPEQEEATQTQAETTEASQESSSDAPLTLSDDWKDFTFELEGVVYQLPCSYQTFVDNGWHLYSTSGYVSEDDEINGLSYGEFNFSNGEKSFYVYIYNPTGNTKALKDCKIGTVKFSASHAPDFELARGINIDSTKEQVESAYGRPSSSHNSDDADVLRYGDDSDHVYLRFEIHKSSGNYFQMENMIVTAEDTTEVSEELPEYLSSYKAPSEVGNDITAPIFQLDGKVYRLPCPLSEFTDAGWSVNSASGDGIASGCIGGSAISITNGDLSLTLDMMNFSKNSTIPENCAVCSISFLRYSGGKSKDDYPDGFLKFPCGLDMNFDADDLKKVCVDFDDSITDGNVYDICRSYDYFNDDSTVWLRYEYTEDNDSEYSPYRRYITIKNTNWDY